jgi:hypothetical protein
MAKPRRRQAGEGSISEYATKAGPRVLIEFTAQREDGTKRVVLKRGFRTRKDVAAALRAQIRRTAVGEWVEPSKQRLDAYLAEWVQGLRLSPYTVASYRKNIRLEALGEDRLPAIRLQDLRLAHATLLLADGVPVKVVSERLGHASAMITLTVYQHVHPAWAARLRTASLRCWKAEARSKYHGGITRAFAASTRKRRASDLQNPARCGVRRRHATYAHGCYVAVDSLIADCPVRRAVTPPTAATASMPVRTAIVSDIFPRWASRPSWWGTARS